MKRRDTGREERKHSLKFGAAFLCTWAILMWHPNSLLWNTSKFEFFMRPCGILPLANYIMWDVKSGLNPLLPGTALSTSLSPAESALEWIPGRWLKLEQLSKCSLDPEEVPTSLPGQMMREPVLQSWPSFSLALLNNVFHCLSRHRVDQQACCLSRLIPGEWMKGRSFFARTSTLDRCLFGPFWILEGIRRTAWFCLPLEGIELSLSPRKVFTDYF